MNTKDFVLETKSVSDEGEFEGYGSIFGGKPDSYGDIVMPGAFIDSLKAHKTDKSMPLMLFGHKASELTIGQWTEMDEDKKGLRVKGQFDLEDPLGQRVHRKVKKGEMKGLSIGYELVKYTTPKDKPGVFQIDEVNLWEVSVVNFPANRRAAIDAVKSTQVEMLRSKLLAGVPPTIREFEHGLGKALDLSNSQAERAVRILLKGLNQGDPELETEKPAVKEAVQNLRNVLGSFLKP